MLCETVTADVVVVGGGPAGVCAAVAAARQGSHVTLVQNRPVLGGNSSSEVRVWVCGATAHGVHMFARETGIMGELFVDNQFTNPDGNPYYWDLVLLEKAQAEENLDLFLNTDITEVEAHGADDARVIDSVTGWMTGSERRITFTASAYIDCSGDGLVGALAGAEVMTGSESRAEFDESWAPTSATGEMLGSTILFYSKDVGHPQKFVPPSFAIDITQTEIPRNRVISETMKGCAFWWIEWGGDRDIVHDNERIRDELQGVCYGIWDYIKNSGKFDAENLSLEWIGAVPGKREYRRFVGDHVLTQHDVLGQPEFEDAIGYGGWSIDLHPAGGVYASEAGSRHWHPDGNYTIPLRVLYSKNVTNLWMAGRDISATHVAHGSTRVMATCGVLGEAAGTAAALAAQRGISPRALASEHVEDLHHAMIRADASLLGVPDTDPANLAHSAEATASSTLSALGSTPGTGLQSLENDLGLIIPVDPSLDGLDVLVDASRDTDLSVDLHTTSKPQNYLPHELLQSVSVPVPAGRHWVHAPLAWTPARPRNAFVALKANPAVNLLLGEEAAPGTAVMRRRAVPPGDMYTEQWRTWKEALNRTGICFRATAPTEAFAPPKAVGGFTRPYGGPNMWISAPLVEDPEPWLQLTWDELQTVRTLSVVLDDDVNEDLINLHHHHTESEVMPTLVRNARIEARTGEGWIELAWWENIRTRRHDLRLETPVTTTALRITCEETNGARQARIVGFRAYGD